MTRLVGHGGLPIEDEVGGDNHHGNPRLRCSPGQDAASHTIDTLGELRLLFRLVHRSVGRRVNHAAERASLSEQLGHLIGIGQVHPQSLNAGSFAQVRAEGFDTVGNREQQLATQHARCACDQDLVFFALAHGL